MSSLRPPGGDFGPKPGFPWLFHLKSVAVHCKLFVQDRIIIGRREPASLEGKCFKRDSSVPIVDQLLLSDGKFRARSSTLSQR